MGSRRRGSPSLSPGTSVPTFFPEVGTATHFQPPQEIAGMPTAHRRPLSAKSTLEMGAWIKKSSVCCRLGQCRPQPTLSLWGYFSICLMFRREVQTFCKMYGVVGLHIDCFSWKGCYSESDPPTPCPHPCQAQAGTQRASKSWNERCGQRESAFCTHRLKHDEG